MAEKAPVDVRHNEPEKRYEAHLEGHLAVCEYELAPDCMTITHTIVPGALEGRGVGSALARCALDDARARALRVIPQCTFIRGYIEKHPEYQDLVLREGP